MTLTHEDEIRIAKSQGKIRGIEMKSGCYRNRPTNQTTTLIFGKII